MLWIICHVLFHNQIIFLKISTLIMYQNTPSKMKCPKLNCHYCKIPQPTFLTSTAYPHLLDLHLPNSIFKTFMTTQKDHQNLPYVVSKCKVGKNSTSYLPTMTIKFLSFSKLWSTYYKIGKKPPLAHEHRLMVGIWQNKPFHVGAPHWHSFPSLSKTSYMYVMKNMNTLPM